MRDDRPERGPDGLFDALEAFFEALRRAAEEGEAGERGSFGDRVRVDYDYDVRTGLGPGAPGRKGHPRFRGAAEDRGRSDDGAGTGPEARPTHVTVEDDRGVATVDVSDVGVPAASSLAVTADDDELRVGYDGRLLASVPLADGPWSVADVRLNNGVLAVEVVPA